MSFKYNHNHNNQVKPKFRLNYKKRSYIVQVHDPLNKRYGRDVEDRENNGCTGSYFVSLYTLDHRKERNEVMNYPLPEHKVVPFEKADWNPISKLWAKMSVDDRKDFIAKHLKDLSVWSQEQIDTFLTTTYLN